MYESAWPFSETHLHVHERRADVEKRKDSTRVRVVRCFEKNMNHFIVFDCVYLPLSDLRYYS